MSRFVLLSSALVPLFLAGCATEGPGAPVAAEAVQLEWHLGQTFYVAATDALETRGGPADGIDLDDPSAATPGGATWTQEHIWTYQVVEADLVPEPSDLLHDFAVDAAGRVVPLTVIRATLDPELNPEGALLASDPSVYLVFRARRNRLAGIVQYTTRDGERVEQAWAAGDLDRAGGTLTQSHLSLAPSYLAPWSARWTDDEHALENGALVTSVSGGSDAVDVFFDDELGGQLVSTRYELGAPWPVWTATGAHESRLLSADELSERRLAPGDEHRRRASESANFRSALASAPNLSAARSLSADELAAGRIDWVVGEELRPWAGYWWPTREAELVFGYEDRPTFAQRIQSDIDDRKIALDELFAEGNYTGWGRANADLTALIMDFYDGILERLDGGQLRIEGGRMVGIGPDGAEWDYAVDQLSPLDKWALVQWLRGETAFNPFRASAWEILNAYAPNGEGWWGHCNGWSGAAVLTRQPEHPRTVSFGGHDVTFTTADQKGLLTEMHMGVSSNLFGTRYGGARDDLSDLSPKAFLTIMGHFVADRGVPVVVDATATEQVWNYPAWKVEVDLQLVEERSDALHINTATLDELVNSAGLDVETATAIIDLRTERGAFQSLDEVADVAGVDPSTLADTLSVDPVARLVHADILTHLVTDGVHPSHVDADPTAPATDAFGFGATLELDRDGRVIGGWWDDDARHPDFAWAPYGNGMAWADSRDENTFVKMIDYIEIFGEDITR